LGDLRHRLHQLAYRGDGGQDPAGQHGPLLAHGLDLVRRRGSILGLSLATLFGIAVGRYLGASLNPLIMKWASGALFIAMGVWILASKAS